MDRILTKYFWILNLFTLVVSACLLAGGTGELVASEVSAMLPPVENKLATTKRKKRTATRPIIQANRNGEDILSRNIFDSVIGPIGEDEEDDFLDDEELPTSVDGLPVVPCTNSKVTLFATVASEDNPDWSFASIADNGENKLCRVGDEVDGRVVSRIFWKYLFLRGQSDECFVGLFDDGVPPIQAAKPVARPGAAKSAVPNDIKNGIHFVSETERVVDRAIVDKLISNPSQFIRSVRVRPYRKDGKISGFKIRRFKPDSPLALLGAKKGDIIHSVNGIELTSVDKALGAYQGLRSSGNLTFSITRMGKPMELQVGIR